MSWFSTNYEKAALGGGIALALGLGVLGWLKLSGTEEDFSANFSGAGNNSPAVKDADLVTKTAASLQSPRVWDQADVSGRPVNLFTGIPLFMSKSGGNEPVDPWGGAPIHPPIDNQWWLKYRLDPGYGDSPQRDPDGDGFSNLEEYEAKTDPTNASDYPSIINKLRFVRDESLNWVLRPSYGADGGFPFRYWDSKKAENKTPTGEVIKPNGVFFADGPMKGRFKLLGSEQRKVVNEKLNYSSDVNFVRVEDQKENKGKKIYEFPENFREADAQQYSQFDRTAVLVLDALGQGANEFSVEENTTFALPKDGAKKDYLLKSVTPDKIEVEYTGPDGTKKVVEIPKR